MTGVLLNQSTACSALFYPFGGDLKQDYLQWDLIDILVWKSPIAELGAWFGFPQWQTMRQRFEDKSFIW